MQKPSPQYSFLIFTILCLVILCWCLVGTESLTGPTGSMGDDVYFENIAYHLERGEGIRFNFTDEQWQKPYADTNVDQQHEWILCRTENGLTTSRSPGFPMMTAVIYRLFGRKFLLVRCANVLVLALSLTWLITLVHRFHGRLAAVLSLATISADGFVLQTAGRFMTEALGTAIVCAVFSACVLWTHREAQDGRSLLQPKDDGQPPASSAYLLCFWLGVGLLFGFGMLVRANLNAWFPLIVAASGVFLLRNYWTGRNCKRLIFGVTAFSIGVLIVAAPYWIRNCSTTGGFTPFGTSGSFGLIGGHCDEAYDDFGNWQLEVSNSTMKITQAKPGFDQLPLAEQELWLAKDSIELSKNWALANGEKMPGLVLMKAISHLGFYRQPFFLQLLNGLLFLGAIFGVISTRRSLGL